MNRAAKVGGGGLRVGAMGAVAAVALAGFVACRRQSAGPDCAQVAASAEDVARRAVGATLRADAAEDLVATLTALAAGTATTVERACREDRWPQVVRACFAAAATPEALHACREAMPVALRQNLVEPLLPADLPDVVRQRIQTLTPPAPAGSLGQ